MKDGRSEGGRTEGLKDEGRKSFYLLVFSPFRYFLILASMVFFIVGGRRSAECLKQLRGYPPGSSSYIFHGGLDPTSEYRVIFAGVVAK